MSIDEVITTKPNQVPARLCGDVHARVWLAGDLTDIGHTADDLGVTIHRRFASPSAMFHAALGTVDDRQRLHRHGEGPSPLYLLMSEAAFPLYRTEKRFRRVLDHRKPCYFSVLVVCSWLCPLRES
ncbi:hypothetical protein [Lentzea sp. CC55]|uniref:hypothetical protein n=1 Tax=Lentzea sp. CC55 TaxID=2884909 RepID=UPI001F2491CB|nr:hypothetical protein [Lentzea sp. CC55]MCG8925650.1 hypothetical protein [Lentzea sp. CC55]